METNAEIKEKKRQIENRFEHVGRQIENGQMKPRLIENILARKTIDKRKQMDRKRIKNRSLSKFYP